MAIPIFIASLKSFGSFLDQKKFKSSKNFVGVVERIAAAEPPAQWETASEPEEEGILPGTRDSYSNYTSAARAASRNAKKMGKLGSKSAKAHANKFHRKAAKRNLQASRFATGDQKSRHIKAFRAHKARAAKFAENISELRSIIYEGVLGAASGGALGFMAGGPVGAAAGADLGQKLSQSDKEKDESIKWIGPHRKSNGTVLSRGGTSHGSYFIYHGNKKHELHYKPTGEKSTSLGSHKSHTDAQNAAHSHHKSRKIGEEKTNNESVEKHKAYTMPKLNKAKRASAERLWKNSERHAQKLRNAAMAKAGHFSTPSHGAPERVKTPSSRMIALRKEYEKAKQVNPTGGGIHGVTPRGSEHKPSWMQKVKTAIARIHPKTEDRPQPGDPLADYSKMHGMTRTPYNVKRIAKAHKKGAKYAKEMFDTQSQDFSQKDGSEQNPSLDFYSGRRRKVEQVFENMKRTMTGKHKKWGISHRTDFHDHAAGYFRSAKRSGRTWDKIPSNLKHAGKKGFVRGGRTSIEVLPKPKKMESAEGIQPKNWKESTEHPNAKAMIYLLKGHHKMAKQAKKSGNVSQAKLHYSKMGTAAAHAAAIHTGRKFHHLKKLAAGAQDRAAAYRRVGENKSDATKNYFGRSNIAALAYQRVGEERGFVGTVTGAMEAKDSNYEKLVKGYKKHPGKIDNPWALAHWADKKGYNSHKREKKESKECLNGDCVCAKCRSVSEGSLQFHSDRASARKASLTAKYTKDPKARESAHKAAGKAHTSAAVHAPSEHAKRLHSIAARLHALKNVN